MEHVYFRPDMVVIIIDTKPVEMWLVMWVFSVNKQKNTHDYFSTNIYCKNFKCQ